MRYSLACLSDVGVVREHNEDNFAFFGNVMPAEHRSSDLHTVDVSADSPFSVAVFDGIGGGAAGEVASFAAAVSLDEYANNVSDWDRTSIASAYDHMNRAVLEAGVAEKAPSMGSTVVMLASSRDGAWVSNLGDSLAMLYDGEGLSTLTLAHTNEEMLNLLGITGHKPGLTQYLGIDSREMAIEPHVAPVHLRPGCCLLLCSDGLANTVPEACILHVLMKEQPAQHKALEITKIAKEYGGQDNITVIVCNVAGGGDTV